MYYFKKGINKKTHKIEIMNILFKNNHPNYSYINKSIDFYIFSCIINDIYLRVFNVNFTTRRVLSEKFLLKHTRNVVQHCLNTLFYF